MEIVEFSPRLLPELTQLVSQHIRSVPPGWTLTEEQVSSVLSDAAPFWALHYKDEQPANSQITCVLHRGQLVAAAQWDRWLDSEGERRSTLYWAAACPENSEGLNTLLDAVISQASALNCSQIITSRFGFGGG